MHLLYAFAEITDSNIALTAQRVSNALATSASLSALSGSWATAQMVVINVRLAILIATDSTPLYGIDQQSADTLPAK
jgi:hypothetical protein